MHTIKITSQLSLDDIHELIRATTDEIYNQYYFKGSHSSIKFDPSTHEIIIVSSDDERVLKISGCLFKCMTKMNLDRNYICPEPVTPASGGRSVQYIAVRKGLTREETKALVHTLKNIDRAAQPRILNGSLSVQCSSRENAENIVKELSSSGHEFPLDCEIISS